MSGPQSIVLDTSVLVNVIASGHAEQILMALPGPLFVVDQVLWELRYDPREPEPREPNPAVLHPFLHDGLLRHVALTPAAKETLFDLASAPAPDNLHDGEAAVIAHALHAAAAVATDDGKARRVCRERFPQLKLVSSVDIFRDPGVAAVLGGRLPEALLCAVSRGRMRVARPDRGWARDVLQELAECCPYI